MLLRSSAAGDTYLTGAEVHAFATRLSNRKLATTLDTIGREGASSLFEGVVGLRLVEDLSAAGCIVTMGDIESVAAERRSPIVGNYRGYEVRQTPPVSTGFALLQMLAVVERFDPDALSRDPALSIHVMVKAKKLAFVERERFGGDPTFTDFDVGRLLDSARIDALARGIDSGRAADRPVASGTRGSGETTYFCVVDNRGRAVSAIQSLNGPFGSGVLSEQTGILMNNRMVCWHLEPGHPNRLAPGKKVRHTMNAPMVLKNGRLWAVLCTPGADNQV